jgi:hypothetical protein
MRRPGVEAWLAGAFGGALALAVVSLSTLGVGEGGTSVALRVTARWSYGFFWPAYAGGALAALCGPVFQPLARRGRDLGLAFAAAHLVHAGLVAWLYHIAVRPPVPVSSLIFFGIALLFTYLLALLSIGRLAAMLPPVVWQVVRTVGVEYIALAFLRDFISNPFHGGFLHLVAYLPFLALGAGGVLLRLAALGKRLWQAWRAPRVPVPNPPAEPRAADDALLPSRPLTR